MLAPAEIRSQLAQCYGTEVYYKHQLVRKVVYTDGVRTLAVAADCYWLLDIIASTQHLPQVGSEEFQCWKLSVKNNTGVVSMTDGNDGPAIYTQIIEFTDFPLDSIEIWVEGGPENPVMLLPSEH